MTNANETDGLVTCPKCAGAGKLPHLRHVEGGVCFRCEGAGRCAPETRKARKYTRDLHQEIRNLYRAATRRFTTEDERGPLTYEYVLDERDGMAWTHEGLIAALDLVPGSREAFRALGWPV